MNEILQSWTIPTYLLMEPPWSNDPDERFAFDPIFDEFEDYTQLSAFWMTHQPH